MSTKDALGDRMKEFYENRSKTYLTRRTPVIIRLDGKAFHSFTKGFKRPYDEIFHEAMNETLRYLCKNIQGCKIGYTQSDEITLLLTDYEKLTTDAWFGYSVQKMCSVAASMATFAFNRVLACLTDEYYNTIWDDIVEDWRGTDEEVAYYNKLLKAVEKGGMFDCRCFNIPQEEVANCFIWRQQDATRNAIQMLGQTYFSHKELDKKDQNDIQDMLMLEKGINFNDMPVPFKRGVCCYRKDCSDVIIEGPNRKQWVIDLNIPIFTQDREFIEKWIG